MHKIAIIVLACRDYASFELSMAAHARTLDPNVPFYILQNCRGSYDAERTLGVAHRYAKLYPRTIQVVEDFAPDAPYFNIKRLVTGDAFRDFDFICKIDDDAFPLTDGWLQTLWDAWFKAKQETKIAYATPLINNNNWGFTEILTSMGLADEYYASIAREHIVGSETEGRRIIPASEIETGTDGTIWGYPYIARWIHQRTSFQPDAYIDATRTLAPSLVDGSKRYSIGCVLFEKQDWLAIELGDNPDDEHMWHMKCLQENLQILCVRSVPFVHLAYFTQREENRDLVEDLKQLYAKRFELPFPISLYHDKLTELEARLRWLEDRSAASEPPVHSIPSSAASEPPVHSTPGSGADDGKQSFLRRLFRRT